MINSIMGLRGKNLLSVSDLSREEIQHLVLAAAEIKWGEKAPLLEGKTMALLFEKPSLRTRVSFEVAMWQLGGQAVYLSPDEVGLGQREAVSDVARVITRYVEVIVARTFSHQTLELLARYADVPVINALSNLEHPCQALADLLTIYEKKGSLQGLDLAFVGDVNNVAHSLLLATSLMGANFKMASPAGYFLEEKVLQLARELARQSGGHILCTAEPQVAVEGADVVYTDVWTSMGQEAEVEQRRLAFAGYQVDAGLLSLAKRDALLMHPLPAHHGEELAEGLIDSPQAVVFDQAENRLHLQKALLVEILGENDD